LCSLLSLDQMHGMKYAKKASAYNINDAFSLRENISCQISLQSVHAIHRVGPLQNATQENILVPAPPPTHFVSLPTLSRPL
jgi:hypothetical protein